MTSHTHIHTHTHAHTGRTLAITQTCMHMQAKLHTAVHKYTNTSSHTPRHTVGKEIHSFPFFFCFILFGKYSRLFSVFLYLFTIVKINVSLLCCTFDIYKCNVYHVHLYKVHLYLNNLSPSHMKQKKRQEIAD